MMILMMNIVLVVTLLKLMVLQNGGKSPLSYQSFVKLAGEPSWASAPVSNAASWLPPVGDVDNCQCSDVPSINELGYEESAEVWESRILYIKWFFQISFFLKKVYGQDERTPFKGGESEALRRLMGSMSNKVSSKTTQPFQEYCQIPLFCLMRLSSDQ